MARVAVEKLSLKQIQELEGRIAVVKAKAADAAKAELKSKIDALLANSGFTIGDLYPITGRGRGRGLSKSSAKYANPEDRSQTWTGRGRKPNWLVARLKKGAKMEDFAL